MPGVPEGAEAMHGNRNLWMSLALTLRRIRLEAAGVEALPGDGRYLLVSNHSFVGRRSLALTC